MFASTGHLYENGFTTDLKDDDWKWFEVDEGDEDDRSDLQALTAAAQGSGDFSDRMAGKADLDEMVSMWATEKYVGQWDGYAGVFEDWTAEQLLPAQHHRRPLLDVAVGHRPDLGRPDQLRRGRPAVPPVPAGSELRGASSARRWPG